MGVYSLKPSPLSVEHWAGPSQGFQVVPVSTLAQWAPGPVSDLHQCKAQADISTSSQLISVCLSSRRGASAATHHRSEIADPLQLLPFQEAQDMVPPSPRRLWQGLSWLTSALAITFCLLPVSLCRLPGVTSQVHPSLPPSLRDCFRGTQLK